MQVTITLNSREFEKAIEVGAMQTLAAVMKELESGPKEMAISSENKQGQAPQQPQAAPVQTPPVQTPPAVPTAPTSQPVQQPVQTQAPVQPPQQPVPTTAPKYTMDQLAVAATQLVDAGRREELVQLLQSFGAPALMSLPQEQYGAFATKLREMGAKI